jgi:hypothetical protein
VGRQKFQVPRWLDIPFRGLKYLLLGFFVWAVAEISTPEISQFMHSPFGTIADVKMLDFFQRWVILERQIVRYIVTD